MDDDQVRRPFGRVVGEATNQFASLMRLDLRLLEVEMKQKASDVVSSGLCGAVAISCFFLGGFAVVESIILALVWLGFGAIAAALIVGIVLCAAGFISLRLARQALSGWTLTPERTVMQVRNDLTALKDGIRHVAS